MKTWPTVEHIAATAPLPVGYRYQQLSRSEIPRLVEFLRKHYPGIEVGNASCHLREDFYTTRVSLLGEDDRDFFVMLFMHGEEIAGMHSTERDPDSEVLYGRIGAVATAHRGAKLSYNFLSLMESLGRAMGAGIVYGLGTLKYPQMQRAFERAGWRLIGIMPGFDREMDSTGLVKRVYEAVYVKVLVPDDDLPPPRVDAMTPRVRALFELLFRADEGR
jgi:hypothetical protein